MASHKPRSLRSNMAWTSAGNIVYAACQWAILVVLARLGTTDTVGQFALALAVAGPVMMLANLQLRWVQATDSRGELDLRDCMTLRLVGSALALLFIGAISVALGYDRECVSVILLVALAKAIEGVCDVFYGWYHQQEQMELISRSLMLRGPLSVVAVAVGFATTGSLTGACATLAATWMAILLWYDLPRTLRSWQRTTGCPFRLRWHSHELRPIFLRALPVGLTTGLATLQASVPRYFIEQHFGKSELGVFAAMAYVLFAADTLVRAVNQAAMPRLARYLKQRDVAGFRSVLWKLVWLGSACGLATLLPAAFLGKFFLGVVYGAEYAQDPGVLTLLVFGAAIAFALRPPEVGLRSMQQFWAILAVHAAGLPFFLAINYWWVPAYGMWGAAYARLAQIIWHGTAILIVYRRLGPQAASSQPPVGESSDLPLRGPNYLRRPARPAEAVPEAGSASIRCPLSCPD